MVDEFLNPQKILETISLKEEMSACDLGCGSGGWAIPLSKILKSGIVFAIDIMPEAISALEGKIARQGITNIRTTISNVEKGVKLGDDSVDLVLLTNILFEVDNKEEVLKEAKRIVKSGGKILIIDWKEGSPIKINDHMVDFDEIRNIINQLSLKIERESDAGKFHWSMLIIKP
jgi:ubiquinone/menaquinone biosynthesis C-methylase UbiE